MDYSYENYYQAVRRFWRFGQKNEVNVYIVIGSTEQHILNVVREKEDKHKEMKLSMVQQSKLFLDKEINHRKFTLNLDVKKIDVPDWIGAGV
jgi:hypothetical protein